MIFFYYYFVCARACISSTMDYCVNNDTPFTFRYDDINTEKLRVSTREDGIETDVFYFDPKIINWED